MKPPLSGSHQTTYDAVFRHPISRNLDWREMVSMLGALQGVVLEQHRGTLKVARNGHTLVMHQPLRWTIGNVQELMNLRRFLEHSSTIAEPAQSEEGAHLLVVIDHRLARIYRAEVLGSVPQRVVPYDRAGFGRHLHYVQDDANGQRRPAVKSFYEAVAKTLEDAGKILFFGSGTGATCAMAHLLSALRLDHPQLADRVVGSVVVDEQHLSEGQLLAQARTFYEGLAQPEGT